VTVSRRTRFRLVAGGAAAIGALAGAFACGENLPARLDSDPDAEFDASFADSSTDSSSVTPEATCDRAKPFGPASTITIAGDWSLEAARFTQDRANAYVALCPTDGGSTGCDLYASELRDGGLGVHTLLAQASGGDYDSYPTVTADGERLVFGSRRSDAGFQIWFSTAINGTFSGSPELQRFSTAFTLANEPYVLGDGKALYFAAKTNGARSTIYVTREWGTDAAAGATPLAGLPSGAASVAPVIANDELELFFATDIADPDNFKTGYDIHRATRAQTSEPFASSQKLADLSGAGNDWPVWISPDGCDLYFINKDPVSGIATLREASRR
jgi:hypothetical protein